jgi:single-stranded-DNA-specific exonuclease
MVERQWVVRGIDRDEQMAMASMLSLSPITASVLLARGVVTKDQAHRWLSPHQAEVYDPFLIPDMERAVDRLHQAISTAERICFYGDYDVDGISATSLYLTFFRRIGADACWYIPHRLHEGYGLNEQAIHHLAAEGVKVLVSSDCGTTSYAEVETANRLGMDVIITDHHQGGDRLPPAWALLNPHRTDSRYPFSGLCSAGLAYKVVAAYEIKYGGGGIRSDSLLDLVALATIADVVPLQDENRHLVRAGLALISDGSRAGIRALKQEAGIDRVCTSGTVAFRLAPRINAAGRLAHAAAGVRLLTTDSDSEGKELAEQHEQWNRDRQRIEEEMTADALAAVRTTEMPAALVVWSRQWHVGVVGIVAARLAERYHCPAVVVAVNESGIGRGSARSVPGFDLYHALVRCRDVLEGFGGHPCAAGLTIRESRLPEFLDRFTDVAERWSGGQPRTPVLHVDAEVSLADMGPRVVRELDLLNPFGAGNPEPMLVARNLKVLAAQVVGDRHLKLTVRQHKSLPFESIGFRMGALTDRGLVTGQSVDVVFMPELQRWNGLDRIQLKMRDLRATGPM